MKLHVRTLGGCLVGIWALAGLAVAGCGDDSSGTSDQDSGVTPTPPPTPPPGPSDDAQANAADVTVYTGTAANIDASSSNGSTFTWTVKTVPTGSKVTTASLTGANGARPSFTTDVSGDYVLELVVGSGAASSTKQVTVRAVPAPIFYQLTNLDQNAPYFEIRTVGMDGTGGHAVNCRQQSFNDGGDASSGDTAGLFFMALIQADMGVDWWEAPPGQPSRAAFQDFRYQTDGAAQFSLAVGTNDSTCQNPPKIVRALPNLLPDGGQPGANQKPAVYQPRFSPDGSRIAYIEQRPEGYYLATVGADGQDYHQIATWCPGGVNDCWSGGDVLIPPRPQWIDANTVAWVRNINGADAALGWEVVSAADSLNPNPSRYMSCAGRLPLGFAPLKDGSIIANEHPFGQAADLTVLKPSSAGGTCTVVRNLTNLGTERSYARDFSVSPDGKKVAFMRRVTPADAGDASVVTFGGQIYVADIDGTTPPQPLTTPAQEAMFGPRYIAQGAFISYNGIQPLPDGSVEDAGLEAGSLGAFDGGAPAIVAVPSGGGSVSYVATSNLGQKSLVVGGGNGGGCGFGGFSCAITNRTANLAGSLSALAIAGLLVARRRRKS